MIDEMDNQALIGYVTSDEDATEAELELATRLGDAVQEIEALAQQVHRLIAEATRREHGDTRVES